MDANTSDTLLAVYGLAAPAELLPLSGGMNNTNYLLTSGGSRFVLKRYETTGDPESLSYEHRLLSWLAAQSLPFAVPVPRLAASGATLVEADGALWGMFTWLPGEPPQPMASQVEAFGQAFGTLHRALVAFPITPRPGMQPYGALENVHPAVPDPAQLDLPAPEPGYPSESREALDWWRREIGELRTFVAGPYHKLPWQVVHGDVAFSNSLFVGERLTALLDFEFAGPDARAIDLAAAIHGLLRREAADAMVPTVRALLRGYQSAAVLTEPERAALPQLIRLRGAVDTIWWVGRHLVEGQAQAANECLRQAWQRAIRMQPRLEALPNWLQ